MFLKLWALGRCQPRPLIRLSISKSRPPSTRKNVPAIIGASRKDPRREESRKLEGRRKRDRYTTIEDGLGLGKSLEFGILR